MFLISIYLQSSLEEYFFNQKGVELLTHANIAANVTAPYIELKHNENWIKTTINQLEIDKSIRVIITDKEANVLFDTSESNNLKGKVLLKEEVLKALKGEDVQTYFFEEEIGWIIEATVPIIKESQMIGVVYISTLAEDIINFLNDIRNNMYTLTFIVSILIGLLSFVMAGIITGPVEELTAAISRMSGENFNQKVEVRGKGEIAQLGLAFNRMNDRLHELEEKRRQFVSDASHELKTPLSSIKVLSESLLQTEDLEQPLIREFLTDINNEIDRLSRIIEKLLALTKMDAEKKEYEIRDVNIRILVQRIIKSLRPLADKNHIHLKFKGKEDIFVLIEEDKIWEAVFNIIDNSIKYTPEGGNVEVRLDKTEHNIIIQVKDTGIGISEEEIYKIFDRFYRVDKARSRDTGGTGLGLSIALSAVRLHGGDIKVESNDGQGSIFTIIIPYRQS